MKFQQIALTIALFAVSATGFAAESDTIKQSVEVDQTISVDSPADPATAAAGEAINVAWTVNSNNAFKYSFSGTSKDDAGADLKYPQFIKQDVDANGNLVDKNYDVLDTSFGVALSDYESVQNSNTWGKGEAAVGEAKALVADTSDATSPYGTMGRVMTGDKTGKATISLFSKGIADASDQSGIYNSEVMLTVTAEEQLGG
ncbi:hypothetical protein SAMN05660964_02562 [Thiothrix caldifontis]|uniref:Uncharacterized protein n=1 Tax=Thiothrix caldifontis TaxID=525918 RepID=A0A1H4EGG4_9GAMM|nr:hypothetical protein [Thiothrix caldifontis]SEA83322.1 hypothetical protein SAMN05660964_02562 [Thiothrix caldifontis]